MIDRDDVKQGLFGVQLACIFGFVGLGSFAIGWFHGVDSMADQSAGAPSPLGASPVSISDVAATGAPAVPQWVQTALWAVTGVLLLATLADLYLAVDEGDVDITVQDGDQDVS